MRPPSSSDRGLDETTEFTPLGLPQGLGGFCASPNGGATSSSAEAVEPLGQAQGRLSSLDRRQFIAALALAGLPSLVRAVGRTSLCQSRC